MYTVWKVLSDKGDRFFVVNPLAAAHKVQSTWKSYLEAKAVCDNLNRIALKAMKKAV